MGCAKKQSHVQKWHFADNRQISGIKSMTQFYSKSKYKPVSKIYIKKNSFFSIFLNTMGTWIFVGYNYQKRRLTFTKMLFPDFFFGYINEKLTVSRP